MSFMQYNGRQLTATLSIGVAELVQQHTAAELLDNAQTALSVAKLKTNAVSMFA
jgi:GGDEF domain-containing protein